MNHPDPRRGQGFRFHRRPRTNGRFDMIDVTIHSMGSGTCSFSGKEASDGVTVTFKDGTAKEAYLSTKSFLMLLRMKAGQKQKSLAVPLPAPAVPR